MLSPIEPSLFPHNHGRNGPPEGQILPPGANNSNIHHTQSPPAAAGATPLWQLTERFSNDPALEQRRGFDGFEASHSSWSGDAENHLQRPAIGNFGSPYGQLPVSCFIIHIQSTFFEIRVETIQEVAYSLYPSHSRNSTISESRLPDKVPCLGHPFLERIRSNQETEVSICRCKCRTI